MKEKLEHMLQKIETKKEFEIEEKKPLDFHNAYDIPEVETIGVLENAEDTVYLPEEISCTSDEAIISNDYK